MSICSSVRWWNEIVTIATLVRQVGRDECRVLTKYGTSWYRNIQFRSNLSSILGPIRVRASSGEKWKNLFLWTPTCLTFIHIWFYLPYLSLVSTKSTPK